MGDPAGLRNLRNRRRVGQLVICAARIGADPIAAARDGNRGGVDDIADRDDDQLQEAAASGAVGRVLRFTEGPINPGI
jgi:hypothetical protein